jgi:hypothetical protein
MKHSLLHNNMNAVGGAYLATGVSYNCKLPLVSDISPQ